MSASSWRSGWISRPVRPERAGRVQWVSVLRSSSQGVVDEDEPRSGVAGGGPQDIGQELDGAVGVDAGHVTKRRALVAHGDGDDAVQGGELGGDRNQRRGLAATGQPRPGGIFGASRRRTPICE